MISAFPKLGSVILTVRSLRRETKGNNNAEWGMISLTIVVPFDRILEHLRRKNLDEILIVLAECFFCLVYK
jgi:hypothetical protein